jgi:hypothetical protein
MHHQTDRMIGLFAYFKVLPGERPFSTVEDHETGADEEPGHIFFQLGVKRRWLGQVMPVIFVTRANKSQGNGSCLSQRVLPPICLFLLVWGDAESMRNVMIQAKI